MRDTFAQMLRCFSHERQIEAKEKELVILADTISIKCNALKNVDSICLGYYQAKEKQLKKQVELVNKYLEKGRKKYPYKLLLEKPTKEGI